jgi:phosphoglucomutase
MQRSGSAQPILKTLIDVPRLIDAYYTRKPAPEEPGQRVTFGTSGHRGTSLSGTFNEDHILAICQALVEYRIGAGITGPLFLGMDTHALSGPARQTALEVFAAHDVTVMIADDLCFTPTPVVSHAILTYNKSRTDGWADGVVITPSHNPPADGGFKYNPPSGGPADTGITKRIQDRANELLRAGMANIRRIPYETALAAETTHRFDFRTPYVDALGDVLDLSAVAASGLHIGVDPMGGAAVDYWGRIAERYGLNLETVNTVIDPTFAFMPPDWDGQTRMDCSSPQAMARLIDLKDRFDVAFGNDPDADRHGIVTPTSGLLNPNHFLAVAVRYLFENRAGWRQDATVGKTAVSSAMIDRVAGQLGRRLAEVPVGFKWFVDGLLDGSYGFGGEESAGASFLRRDGTVWTTDKDGLIMGLLSAEITAATGRNPGQHYQELEAQFGRSFYARMDAPATPAQQAILRDLTPAQVTAEQLAGETITGKLTRAPGNDEPLGGLKVVTDIGWFAARPSGTEHIYKIYAESFRSKEHLQQIQEEAQAIVATALTH